MTPETLLPLLHAFATLFMTGLIWFVQVVHYPLFARVGADAFTRYEREHMTRTTWVVAPAMFLELAAAAWITVNPPEGAPVWLVTLGAGLLIVVWVSTFAMQAPMHRHLSNGFDPRTAARLVATNWIRTVAWTGRSVVALALLAPGASS